MKMSSDTNFTVTSWFLRNVHIKPYFNTQCGCLVPQPPHCATPIVFQLFLSNQTETHSEAVAVAAIQLLTHHAKKKFATFLIYHQPSMISYDEARCFHFRFSFFYRISWKKYLWLVWIYKIVIIFHLIRAFESAVKFLKDNFMKKENRVGDFISFLKENKKWNQQNLFQMGVSKNRVKRRKQLNSFFSSFKGQMKIHIP